MAFWSFLFPDVWFKGMNLRTNTAIMLINALRLRRRDPRLRLALRRLAKKHTPDKIANIYAEFSSIVKESPEKDQNRIVKYQAALDSFIDSFLRDYIEFRAYYLDALQLIQASLISSKREGYKELNDVEAIFAELERRRQELIFPTGDILIFKSQLRRLFKDITKDIRSDELSSVRVSRGGYPSGVSILSPKRWWRRAKAYRKEKREIKKLNKNLGIYEQVYSRIVDEFRSGIRQDFLFLLIGLFKRVDIADKRLEEIKQDLDLVLKKLREDLKNVKKTTTAISTLLRNEPQLKTHPKFLQIQQDIEKIEFTFERILQSDFKNTEALKKKLQEVVNEEDLIVNQMYQKSLRLAA